MKGRIFRTLTQSNFTIVSNDIIRSESLSWGAKGLLTYLIGLPPEWKVYKSQLIKKFPGGKTALCSLWAELEKHGYVVSGELNKDSGKFAGKDYYVYDVPQNTEVENQPREGLKINHGTEVENQPLLNTINTSNTYSKHADSEESASEKVKSLYTNAMSDYDSFYKQITTISPKIDGIQGKALKSILKHLTKVATDKSDDGVRASLQYIFANWQKLDAFLQGQLNLNQISHNLNNIINQLKNGKSGKKSSTQDALDQLNEIIRRSESVSHDDENVSSGPGPHTRHEPAHDPHKGHGFS